VWCSYLIGKGSSASAVIRKQSSCLGVLANQAERTKVRSSLGSPERVSERDGLDVSKFGFRYMYMTGDSGDRVQQLY